MSAKDFFGLFGGLPIQFKTFISVPNPSLEDIFQAFKERFANEDEFASQAIEAIQANEKDIAGLKTKLDGAVDYLAESVKLLNEAAEKIDGLEKKVAELEGKAKTKKAKPDAQPEAVDVQEAAKTNLEFGVKLEEQDSQELSA